MKKRNNRAWLRIVEAFTTILLIATVLLLILSKTSLNEAEKSEQILDKEYSILREIQLNSSLRGDVLSPDLAVDEMIIWDDLVSSVKAKIVERTPAQLKCEAQLCGLGNDCVFENKDSIKKGIYSRSALISATVDDYKPRKLKLFCWEVE